MKNGLIKYVLWVAIILYIAGGAAGFGNVWARDYRNMSKSEPSPPKGLVRQAEELVQRLIHTRGLVPKPPSGEPLNALKNNEEVNYGD